MRIMKHTILSRKELAILEKIIANYGSIVRFNEIEKLVGDDYSYDELKNEVSFLAKRGWLVRIKRGVFAVASLESHSFANTSPLVIANVLAPDSYVSFEYALNYYGLFDQLSNRIIGVNTKTTKKFTFQDQEYRFLNVKPDYFFGFKEISINNQIAKVADLEKAILDYLYFRNDTYSNDLVLEKLKDNKDDFDFEKLKDYGLLYSLSVKRRLGFLLNLVGEETDELLSGIKKRGGYSKLTKNSNKFNAKWRIYYEDRFTK